MNTDEVLILQALKFKQLRVDGHDLPGHVVEQMLESAPEAKEKLRNICAFISNKLFEDIEGLCEMLDLSKRQFVEMALIDMVAKANATIAKFDVLPAQEG